MKNIHSVLKKYWGYSAFRPLQEEIIQSVLNQQDTLALLPTGGGKSVCFQVPALAVDGICIVVSPLVALMKDQVENLTKIGVDAAFLHSGMGLREIDITLENAVQGLYKFLYVSPERCQTEVFIERFKRMEVCFLAVDEAHCISQWGYDFRPPYLQIAQLKALKKQLTVLALTASATPNVEADIVEKLEFAPNYQVFRKSFDRQNLVYAVTVTNDKYSRILYALDKAKGTAIIYVRNRRLTKEIASWLVTQKISADFYHAGLTHQERNTKQEHWKQGKTRVMVSTNAFGMGIDKDNVRLVLHYGLPDSLEAYYQEAGRAGRDEKRAYAVALVSESDAKDLYKHLAFQFPEIQVIQSVYHALGNYFQVPIGAKAEAFFPLDVGEFCKAFNLSPIQTVSALRILQDNGYIHLSDGFMQPSRIIFLQQHEELYKFMVANKRLEPLTKALLRSFGGITQNYTQINERKLAGILGLAENVIIQQLDQLSSYKIIDYIKATDKPGVSYLHQRIDKKDLTFDANYLLMRKKTAQQKIEGIVKFAFSEKECRSKILLNYFGEVVQENCNHCDVCFQNNTANTNGHYRNLILKVLSKDGEDFSSFKIKINTQNPQIKETLRLMVEDGSLIIKGGSVFLGKK